MKDDHLECLSKIQIPGPTPRIEPIAGRGLKILFLRNSALIHFIICSLQFWLLVRIIWKAYIKHQQLELHPNPKYQNMRPSIIFLKTSLAILLYRSDKGRDYDLEIHMLSATA